MRISVSRVNRRDGSMLPEMIVATRIDHTKCMENPAATDVRWSIEGWNADVAAMRLTMVFASKMFRS